MADRSVWCPACQRPHPAVTDEQRAGWREAVARRRTRANLPKELRDRNIADIKGDLL